MDVKQIFETDSIDGLAELARAIKEEKSRIAEAFYNQFKKYIEQAKDPAEVIKAIKLANNDENGFRSISLDVDMRQGIFVWILAQAKKIVEKASVSTIKANPAFKEMVEMIHDIKLNEIFDQKMR